MKHYFTKKNILARGIILAVFFTLRLLMSQGPERHEMIFTENYHAYETVSGSLKQFTNSVLFFYAPWCPSCRIVDTDIRAGVQQIPSNLHIINVDYDTNKDLKKKYSVTSQTTFVLVDSQGAMIKKAVGLSSLEEIITFSEKDVPSP